MGCKSALVGFITCHYKSLLVYRLVHAPVITDGRAKAGFDSATESAKRRNFFPCSDSVWQSYGGAAEAKGLMVIQK